MSEYLSRDIGLGIQGVAIKSGAAKKREEDREILLDIMKRSMPPGVKTTVKHRLEMPSGFKIGDRSSGRTGEVDPNMFAGDQRSSMINQLSKEEIFARMGIDGSKELEIDWEEIDPLGNAKTRVELADKMFHVLQKEKSKLEHKKKVFENKLNTFEKAKLVEAEMKKEAAAVASVQSKALKGGYESANSRNRRSARASPAGRSQRASRERNSHSNVNGTVGPDFFESMPHGEQPWTHLSKARAEYATQYGTYGGRLPYQDEVDMMHEDRDRYQEVNHWYSSMEKPSEDNLEVLRKLNQERLNKLGQMYAEQRARESMGMHGHQEEYQESDMRQSVLHRWSNRDINKEKQDYKDKFKKYLYNKERMREQQRSKSPQESRVDFDRYQCTSPNPKYVGKHNIVPYRDNM